MKKKPNIFRILDTLEEKIHDELTGLTCEQCIEVVEGLNTILNDLLETQKLIKIKSNEKTEQTFTE